jgi:hypothetical protein
MTGCGCWRTWPVWRGANGVYGAADLSRHFTIGKSLVTAASASSHRMRVWVNGRPDADFLKAQAARLRGDLDEARTLITECLKHLPGSAEFAAFAEEVGAEVPR